jgi:hypothetical protein
MSVYGIGIDVYIIVAAELAGGLGIVSWALKKSRGGGDDASAGEASRG